MKKFRKLASTALALLLVAAMSLTAFAAPGDLEVDPTLSIGGLQAGDTVTFYKVLGWNDGWVVVNGFSLTDEEFESITKGTPKTVNDGEVTEREAPGISFELAGKLGSQVSSDKDPFSGEVIDGSVVIDGPEAGLYMAIITPGQPGYVYNPVFVAADFSRENNNNVVIDSVDGGILSYSNSGSAKKSPVTLEKEANSITSNVGDNVHFTVTTTIPLYASNYVHPVFKLTDVLSKGLQLKRDSIVVTDANGNVIQSTNYSTDFFENKNDDNEVVETGYEISFTETYLKSLSVATAITVEYDAKVDIEDPTSVSFEDNTVTLHYSNKPNDTVGAGVLRDKTNHYTFDIDGNIFGGGEYITTEVVKIGVDADGNVIEEEKQLSNGNWVGALAGAKFVLYTDEACTQEYTNDWITARGEGGNVIVSDEFGRITIKGLDADDYWLKEVEAPAGYIKAQEAVHIKIEVEKDTEYEINETEKVTLNGEEIEVPVTYKTEVLKNYTISINGVETAHYEMTNDLVGDLISVDHGDNVGNEKDEEGNIISNDNKGKIENTKGVELPSTGGVGTTLFYIIGGCLLVGAGVLLVVKKRVGGKEEA